MIFPNRIHDNILQEDYDHRSETQFCLSTSIVDLPPPGKRYVIVGTSFYNINVARIRTSW